MVKIIGIIPARLGSTRIPEKMLADIHGKTLIQRTIERTQKAKLLDALVVATDSELIGDSARSMGTKVVMWPSPLKSKNGTEGVALALEQFNEFEPDIVVTIWGDEPLYPPLVIDECIKKLLDNPDLDAVAAADKISDPAMLGTDSVVKVVTDKFDRAMYISRSPIPHWYKGDSPDYYHIIGAMVMRREFLGKYVSMSQSALEIAEGVEQLRILENGHKLGIVKVDSGNLGVNTPAELEEVRRIIGKKVSLK